MRVNFVKIKRKQLGDRVFDAITICICDLHFSCDLMDDRQIKLARRLADDQGAWFAYDDHNAERVRRVLGVRADAQPDAAPF